MIKYNAIIPNSTIVQDTEVSPPSRAWFRIIEKSETRIVGQNLATRATKIYTIKDLRELVPARDTPFSETDLSALLGQRVEVELTFGRNVGVVTEVVTKSTKVFECEVPVLAGISIDGEMLRWGEIRAIRPA